MMRKTFYVLIIFVSAISYSLFSQSNNIKLNKELNEQDKIEYLISSIEKLEGAQFYRNRNWHDAKTAAGHLRMKLSKAGNHIKTVQDFIDKVASASSTTGEAYKIKFADGKIVTTKEYFSAKLEELDEN